MPAAELVAPEIYVKAPAASVLIDLEFAGLLRSGETLSAGTPAVVHTPPGATALTVSGSSTVSGTVAQQRVSVGSGNNTYLLSVTVTTSLSNTLVGYFLVSVVNPRP